MQQISVLNRWICTSFRVVDSGVRRVGRGRYVAAMPQQPSLPSLDTLLGFVRDERDKQISHFDALDSKSGIVLGFAGLLITLSPDIPLPLLVPGVVASACAAGFALAAFWPRPHASLRPTPMRKYLPADDRFTRLRLLDTLEVVVNDVSDELTIKARRLTRALTALALAALLFAVGILVGAV
jgi:hypothetical protein